MSDKLRETVSIDDVIEYLNGLIEADRGAIAALISNRVPCNEKMAEHSSLQVMRKKDDFYVGLLGVINGMFGVDEDGYWPILLIIGNDGLKFKRLAGVGSMSVSAETVPLKRSNMWD